MPKCAVCRGTRQAFPLSYDVHTKKLVTTHADNGCPACTEDGPLSLDESWKQLTTFFIHPDDELKTMILVGFLAVVDALHPYSGGTDVGTRMHVEEVRRRILALGNLAQQGKLS